MTLRIHALYHVDFEDLGYIGQWADSRGHQINYTRFYNGDPLPEPDSFDWLIIMGGPMSIHDEAEFAWLTDEKRLIAASISAGKTIIGFCLGAQLIADSLGATVQPSGIKEIGWMPIELTEAGKQHCLLQDLPKEAFTVFHWHGDGFASPKGAIPIATSKTWEHQGFTYQTALHKQQGTWLMGWQCHFEVTPESMVKMVANGRDYIAESLTDNLDSVQTAETILQLGQQHIASNNHWLSMMLDNMAQGQKPHE
ncbi:type 1 glutamine amidotransferase [Psychrobacter sp. BF1]|uniref:type 1 glutamine amidotransferase n=1 Tax=Psychrobacter sp. BF1 TaxID=2821147 RepID=UPI001C4E1E6F|nr:type 1 glutamine amidotransferase [Psychrobacter sp. BF1]